MTKPATVGDNSGVKSYIDRITNILNERDTLTEDLSEMFKEFKNGGGDVKALKAALKELRKPIDSDFKEKVNSYIMVAGQYQLFA